MTTVVPRGTLLRDALNQPWPVAGSELFTHTGKSANRLDSPKLLWMLLQDAFNRQRIALHLPTLPQLHALDESISLSHKILNRLAFVDLYYEQISQHSYLDTDILNLLCQLRPVVIRSLLHSDSFIASSKHLLRIIIDDVCRWGAGWDNSIGKSGEKYFNLLTNLVTIGNGLPEDAEILPDAYATTLNALQELAGRHQQLEQRVCEAEQATMENQAIRRQVDEAINQHIEGNLLPVSAIQFFHGIWRDILHRLRVLDKTDNKRWPEALQLMDQLVFCLAPQPGSKQEQINRIPGLIQALKQTLQVSGFDSSNTYLFDDMMGTFKQVMTGESVTLETVPALASFTVEGVSATISSAISQEVTQLDIGQWILYKGDNGEMLRGRLAQKFPDAGQILLVNLLGAKPVFKNIEALGLALNTRRAHLLVTREIATILLSLTVDLFIKQHQKTVPTTSDNTPDAFKKQSAEKALAEAQQLRKQITPETTPSAPVIALEEDDIIKVEALVHSLKIGSWVSMKTRVSERMPCKVAVIFASTGKMVMTDKAGVRVGEFLRPELVQLIMKGEASILEMADSFESSLSRTLQTLRKQK